jgi:HSP20 family protein
MFNLIPWKKKNNKEQGRELVAHQGHLLAEMRDEFDTLFNRFLSRWFLSRWAGPFGEELGPGRFWGLEVEDRDHEVMVQAEAPGFEPDDLDVQVSGNLLTIKAEKKEESQGRKGDGRYEERRYRTFHRTVTLPPGTDPDKIEAKYHNGLLEVHVPKSEQAKGKRIPVKA